MWHIARSMYDSLHSWSKQILKACHTPWALRRQMETKAIDVTFLIFSQSYKLNMTPIWQTTDDKYNSINNIWICLGIDKQQEHNLILKAMGARLWRFWEDITDWNPERIPYICMCLVIFPFIGFWYEPLFHRLSTRDKHSQTLKRKIVDLLPWMKLIHRIQPVWTLTFSAWSCSTLFHNVLENVIWASFVMLHIS